MIKDNYTDYHQFSWVKISPHISLKKFIHQRIIPYLFLICVTIYYIKYAASQQQIVHSNELFLSLSAISLGVIFLIGTIDFHITKNLPQKVKTYKITLNGIQINGKIYSYTSLGKNAQLSDAKTLGEMSFVIPKKIYGSIKLEYNHLEEKDQIIKALNYYQDKA